MSSRYLRRLEKASETATYESDEESDVEESTSKRLNAFAALTRDDGSSGPSDQEVDEPRSNQQFQSSQPLKTKKKKNNRRKDKGHLVVKTEDEIEESLREVDEFLKKRNESFVESASAAVVSREDSVLKVNFRFVNAENEKTRKWGVKSNRVDLRRGKQKTPRLNADVISPKMDWPPWEKIGESLDFDPVEDLLGVDPFHVDCLIQMSKIFRDQENKEEAADFVERAVFASQLAFHPLFSLTAGERRLPFKYRENRSFYIALTLHMRNCEESGCYQTAFEISKVVFNLEPENDPMAILLLMDTYALYCDAHEWILKAFEFFKESKRTDMLPNWNFSLALSMFHMASAGECLGFSIEDADAKLRDALKRFPGFLLPMLEKCHVVSENQPGFEYFTANIVPEPKPLALLLEIYINASFHVWKSREVMAWVERVVSEVCVERFSGDKTLQDEELAQSYGMWMKLQQIPLNIMRLVTVLDLLSSVRNIASALRRASPLETVITDPFPPLDNVVSYRAPPELETDPALPSWRNELMNVASVNRLLLNSLNPNFPVAFPEGVPLGAVFGAAADEFPEARGRNAGADVMRAFRRSLDDIFQGFLEGVRMAPVGAGLDGNGDGQDNDGQVDWDEPEEDRAPRN
ncbi:unnamed protein product [Notodromas monacha]|uniref:Transcription factor 25 n=1 Tax=Notodromas monacha TaxID=399045 RepID=A0A7R9GFC4_9CRUS|nr:unnamed protein product [Notodromas monacha]CAG0918685.1 unnamed protein product [Notodromas monacha]